MCEVIKNQCCLIKKHLNCGCVVKVFFVIYMFYCALSLYPPYLILCHLNTTKIRVLLSNLCFNQKILQQRRI